MDSVRARTNLLPVVALLLLPLLVTSQPLLNNSINNYADIYKPLQYAVIGQQKSGTSTLWNVLTSHPDIKSVGYGKESFFFNGEVPRTTLCDNLVEEFQSLVAAQRLRYNRTDLLVGDWSATHFSCACCPGTLKTLNPDLKIIVVLRDPVQRTLSRFVEQKRNEGMPFHSLVKNLTFPEYATREVEKLEACVSRAAPLRQPRPLSAQAPMLGWGAGLDIGRWMEMQCYSRSNMVGWSVYDVFLENYLAYFPKEQVLVLYTDELSEQPLQAYRRVEAFLGVRPHNYPDAVVNMVFNSRECYHWQCARKKGEIKDVAANDGVSGSHRDGPFPKAISRLVDLYRPHMQRLFTWAEQGIIAPPPALWRKTYG